MLSYTIVGKMGVSVGDIIETEVSSWESNIVLGIEPDGEWIPVCDDYPLSDIELPVFHYE